MSNKVEYARHEKYSYYFCKSHFSYLKIKIRGSDFNRCFESKYIDNFA